MKKLAAVVFMFVLLHAQALAYVGGPFDPRNSAINVVGTYAAVLIPSNIEDVSEELEDDFTLPDEFTRRASIGMFSLSVFEQGLAEGFFIVFDNGRVVGGLASGFASPEDGQFYAILNGAQQLSSGGEDLTITATGFVDAEIKPDATNLFLVGRTRIDGEAQLAINNGNPDDDMGNPVITRLVTYAVDGVKQSDLPIEEEELPPIVVILN